MEQALDVRHLEPPEPMEQVLAALERLGAADWLRVRLPREPFPLYGLLREMDLRWRGRWRGAEFELLIWPAHQAPPRP